VSRCKKEEVIRAELAKRNIPVEELLLREDPTIKTVLEAYEKIYRKNVSDQ